MASDKDGLSLSFFLPKKSDVFTFTLIYGFSFVDEAVITDATIGFDGTFGLSLSDTPNKLGVLESLGYSKRFTLLIGC